MFIEPTVENIEDYRKEHFEIFKNNILEGNKRLFRHMPEYAPSDEENNAFFEKIYNKDLLHNDEIVVPGTDYNYYEYIKDIQGSNVEKVVVVMLDKDKKPFDSKIVKTGEETIVKDDTRPYCDVFAYALSNPKCKYFIMVHNHPHCICCFPSSGDLAVTYNQTVLSKVFNVVMLDSCIISEFDYYSIYKNETNEKEKTLYPIVDKDLMNEIAHKNNMLYRFLMRGTGEGLY